MLHLFESNFHNVRHVLYSKFLKFVICVEMWIHNCSPKTWRPGGAYISIMGVSFVGLGERVVQGVSALGGGGLTSGDVHVWLHALYAKAWGVHISVGGASFLGRGEGMSTLVGRINNFLKRLLKGSLAKSRDTTSYGIPIYLWAEAKQCSDKNLVREAACK